MNDRDTSEKLFTLRGDHTKSVCFIAWSLNGKYIATSGLDKQVLIWDVVKKQDIERQKIDEEICCMAWKPHGNALAIIDVMGKYGVWDSAVPSSMKSPTEGAPTSSSKRNDGLLFYDEEEHEPSTSGSLSDHAEDSLIGSEPTSRKRLRKHFKYDEDSDEDINDGMDLLPKLESCKKPSIAGKENMKNGKVTSISPTMFTGPVMQGAFQSGATHVQPGKRQFVCYNMLGSITTMKHDEYSYIEWSMQFGEEGVRAVALGNSWVVAVTSKKFLRIFTEGGLQRYVISLDGPVVTATGFGDELADVTHSSNSPLLNEQKLDVVNSIGPSPYGPNQAAHCN